ncbi:MAG: class I SAM-dependent methyltransferase [Candidatus Diapherotrites archaeon]|nr:class I SAM-dependent methyltransferase [Candidatus Diapherotrites archaeon]
MKCSDRISLLPRLMLLNAMKITKRHKILEVGCGEGNTSVLFAMITKCNVVGIDIDKRVIEKAKQMKRKLGIKNVIFRHFSGERMPFKDNTFDAVILPFVLHHVAKRQTEPLIEECVRVCKKDGKIGVIEWGVMKDKRKHHKQVMLPKMLKALFREYNITPLKYERVDPAYYTVGRVKK